jgi:hypothetical protein
VTAKTGISIDAKLGYMISALPGVELDEHLVRVLLLTLVLTVLITRGEILGELLAAALLSTALLVAYTAIQGFWYGYARGKLRETRQH